MKSKSKEDYSDIGVSATKPKIDEFIRLVVKFRRQNEHKRRAWEAKMRKRAKKRKSK